MLTLSMYALAKFAVGCCWLEVLPTPAGTIPEPLLPKMARYTGRARHMESENEFSLDKALSRCSLPSDSWFHLLHLISCFGHLHQLLCVLCNGRHVIQGASQ